MRVFLHTLRDGPDTVAQRMPKRWFSRILFIYFRARSYVEFVLEFVNILTLIIKNNPKLFWQWLSSSYGMDIQYKDAILHAMRWRRWVWWWYATNLCFHWISTARVIWWTVQFKSCLTKHYFQTQTLFFKTVAGSNRTIKRPNHMVSKIILNILPSFSSIRLKIDLVLPVYVVQNYLVGQSIGYQEEPGFCQMPIIRARIFNSAFNSAFFLIQHLIQHFF